jgi:16S rRNA (cytosine1402-N4)-methyltransferase
MMAGRGPGIPAVAGGLARHIPVLARAAVSYLAVRDGGCYIDATFGAGGYTRLLLEASGTQVLAIDRDPAAVAAGADLQRGNRDRLTLVQGRFSELDTIAAAHGWSAVDGVVFDIGVSSMQLDDPLRGFSFRGDGPLDMRMDSTGPSAADVVQNASERELSAVIATLGEERHGRAVARAIVRTRHEAPIRTTAALANLVSRVVRSGPGDIHPATRTFQALRILVNDELAEFAGGLAAAERILKPGGRLAVVSFHSLEDRIAKTFLIDRSRVVGGSRHRPEAARLSPTFTVLTRRPITADADEVARNPRARSAKLRAAERTTTPAREREPEALLPRVPTLAEIMRRR